MRRSVSNLIEVSPYEKLAHIYETVMSHIDYDEWVEYLKRLCGRHELAVQPAVDLSCGTGNIIPHVREWCGTLHCMDLSLPMVRRLLERYPEMRGSTWVGDMSSLPFRGAYNLVINLQDSVNYYLKTGEFVQHLHEVYRVLAPHGAYIFDLSTEQNIRRNFQDFHEVYEDADWGYERVNEYLRRKRLNITEFYIWEKREGHRQSYRERHVHSGGSE